MSKQEPHKVLLSVKVSVHQLMNTGELQPAKLADSFLLDFSSSNEEEAMLILASLIKKVKNVAKETR